MGRSDGGKGISLDVRFDTTTSMIEEGMLGARPSYPQKENVSSCFSAIHQYTNQLK